MDTPTDIYVVMEYVSGGELFDHIVAKGRLVHITSVLTHSSASERAIKSEGMRETCADARGRCRRWLLRGEDRMWTCQAQVRRGWEKNRGNR